MSQTKKQSMKENTAKQSIVMSQLPTIPIVVLDRISTPMGIATSTTLACTVWSIARGYAVRRYFNKQLTQAKDQHTLAAQTHKGEAK